MTKLKRIVITRPTSQERNDLARKVMGPTTALLYNIINTATFRVPLSIVVRESKGKTFVMASSSTSSRNEN